VIRHVIFTFANNLIYSKNDHLFRTYHLFSM